MDFTWRKDRKARGAKLGGNPIVTGTTACDIARLPVTRHANVAIAVTAGATRTCCMHGPQSPLYRTCGRKPPAACDVLVFGINPNAIVGKNVHSPPGAAPAWRPAREGGREVQQ